MIGKVKSVKSLLTYCRRLSVTSLRCKNTWSSRQIRQSFIDFFQHEHGHTFVKSSSVIPDASDLSLILVNAGMNQFKPLLLGTINPNHPFAQLKTAVNSQKCIRCGGKHNDLDEVGKDLRHHTFFEMLGNWSFGSYGKREAIKMAWDLLTRVYHLPPNRLLITYFEGEKGVNGLEADRETLDAWRSIINNHHLLSVKNDRVIISPQHDKFGDEKTTFILGLDSKDCFWDMGDTGPCGPCTEIHYILNPSVVNSLLASESVSLNQLMSSDTLEIWNLVFMQFNRKSDESLESLPRQNVDTGMGLERMASILQTKGQTSNYDTDLFLPLFKQIERFSGKPAYSGSLTNKIDISYRIIADHARMFTIAAADGLVPATEGAGHKLRRIIRSAHWETRDSFGLNKPTELFCCLIDEVAKSLGDAYPEIESNLDKVKSVVTDEVVLFYEKIKLTKEIFKKQVKLKKKELQSIEEGSATTNAIHFTGEEAFSFYKRLGSPKQLIQQLASQHGASVDFDSFDAIAEEDPKKIKQPK